MAISRAQLVKELEPGLNALFGMEYSRYENELQKSSQPRAQTVLSRKKLC